VCQVHGAGRVADGFEGYAVGGGVVVALFDRHPLDVSREGSHQPVEPLDANLEAGTGDIANPNHAGRLLVVIDRRADDHRLSETSAEADR